MIEIYIQFSIDSDECKGVIRIPIAQVLANLRVSSGSFQSVPFASYTDGWGTHAFSDGNRSL